MTTPTPAPPNGTDLSEVSEVADLQREIAALKVDLWSARDAARGAVAEKGTLAARNKELEQVIHQLRVECQRLSQLEQTVAYRLGNVVVRPLKRARGSISGI